MKKSSLLGVAVIALAMIFSSCTKEVETSSMTLDLTKSATIKVNFFAELDYTSQGLELVPDGTSVLIRIPNSSYNGSASGYWTTTQAINLGAIEVEVPVTDAGVNVEIIPIEFFYNQVQPYGSVSSSINKKFRVTTSVIESSVKTGEIRTRQTTYSDMGASSDFEETVSRKYTMRGDIDATEAGLEYVPAGTTITLFADGWMTTANIGSNGVVDVNVPVNEEIYVRFEATKRVLNDDGEAVSIRYRYDAYVGTYSETSPVRQSVDCGSGQIWQ